MRCYYILLSVSVELRLFPLVRCSINSFILIYFLSNFEKVILRFYLHHPDPVRRSTSLLTHRNIMIIIVRLLSNVTKIILRWLLEEMRTMLQRQLLECPPRPITKHLIVDRQIRLLLLPQQRLLQPLLLIIQRK